VAADRTLHQPRMRQPVQPTVLAIARRGGEHQCQAGWLAGFAETGFQRDQQLVRGADADKSGHRDRVARPDDGNGLRWGDDLVIHASTLVPVR
jgi:hypothetical protein